MQDLSLQWTIGVRCGFGLLKKAEMLPSREEYLLDLSLILEGDILIVSGQTEQLDLFNTGD